MFFFFKRFIYNQIDSYEEVKSKRYPMAAKSDKEILLLFAAKFKVEDVNEITIEQICQFRDAISSEFFRLQAVKTLRCFIRHHALRGYGCDKLYDEVVKL